MFGKLIEAYRQAKKISDDGGEVVIWGIVKNSGKLLTELTQLGLKIAFFVDNDPQKQGKLFRGYPVKSPEIFHSRDHANMFVIIDVEKDDSFYAIRTQLERLGFQESTHFADFGIDSDRRFYSGGHHYLDFPVETYDLRMKHLKTALPMYNDNTRPHIDHDTIVIPGFDLKVTTYCTLRCRNCMHNNSYIKQWRHLDPVQIVEDLDRLLSVAYTAHLVILGGEAFLHPELPKIIEGVANLKNIGRIGRFITISNATVVPSEEILESYKNLPNHTFALNNYTHKQNAYDEICSVLDGYGFSHLDQHEYMPRWSDLGDFRVKRDYSDEVLRHKRVLCGAVAQLFDGKFFSCSRTATSTGSGLAVYSEDDYVDVRHFKGSEQDLHDAVYHYLYKKPYLEFCKYCDGQCVASKQVSPAIQLAGRINRDE